MRISHANSDSLTSFFLIFKSLISFLHSGMLASSSETSDSGHSVLFLSTEMLLLFPF